MDQIQSLLTQYIETLQLVSSQAQEFLEHAPEGTLRIARKNNKEQYYWRTDCKDTHGRYIKREQEEFAKKLAQKDYAKKVLKSTENQMKQIQQLMQQYQPEEIIRIYEQLSQQRQNLVIPFILSEEEYVANWLKSAKEKKKQYEKQNGIYPFEEDKNPIYTEQGEQVRSKSEKMLADKFDQRNIPYVYEMPLYLNGYGYFLPDFKVLNKRTRETFYWEHLGLMDQPEYSEKAVKKLNIYEKNKIMTGKNLILTYETKNNPLNKVTVEGLITEYLI